MRITRLAPSPTGALHLGNARTFLINWLLARRNGWRLILRIEELDGPRVKAGADRLAIEDLRWLGLVWDEGPIYQSTRAALYQAALERLSAGGWIYPCVCSRREAEEAASAPHAQAAASIYPGTCRGRFASIQEARRLSGRDPALRFASPGGIVEYTDEFHGPQRFDAARLGDFVVAKADGTPAYQLAVVVDDSQMHITDVVRGDDLLESTVRQLLLYEALQETPRGPRWWHLPLVIGEDGRRLAKRHGDTRLETYRRQGVHPRRLLALLARWCGMECGGRISLQELLDRFDLQAVPRQPIVFSSADDAWLREGGSP
jgi:glutamyl-tRNA synthetase